MKKLVMIGEITDINRYRLDVIKKLYFSSFIIEFSTFTSFINWSRTAKRPLLGGCYLVIVREDNFYNRTIERLKIIEELKSQNNVYDIIYIVKPREVFQEIPIKGLDIINLRKTFRDDFTKMVEMELLIENDAFKDDIVKCIISRIGYSIADFNVYRQDLLALPVLSCTNIKKVITERKVKPIAEIIEGLVSRNKLMLKEHYRLCDKYGNYWVTNMYMEIIKMILETKRKLRSDEIRMVDIRKDDELRQYARLIRDSRTVDLFSLKYLLIRNNRMAIEQYYVAGSSRAIIDKFSLNKIGGLLDVKEN